MFLFAYVGSAKNYGSRSSSFFIYVFGTFPSSSFALCAPYRYGAEMREQRFVLIPLHMTMYWFLILVKKKFTGSLCHKI